MEFIPEVVFRRSDGIIIVKHPFRGGGVCLHRLLKELQIGRLLDWHKDIVFFGDSNKRNLALSNLGLTDRRSWLWFKKGKLYPIPRKWVFRLLYGVLYFSGPTLALLFEVNSPCNVYTAMRARGVKRRPTLERSSFWLRWNKLVRQFISFTRNRKEGRLATA